MQQRPVLTEPLVEHPFIYEINTWVWLDELSGAPGATIDLAEVPGDASGTRSRRSGSTRSG